MKKEEYKNLVENKPWSFISDHFDNLEKFVPKKIATVDIDPEQWIKFSVDYFDQAHQNSEMPKPLRKFPAPRTKALILAVSPLAADHEA